MRILVYGAGGIGLYFSARLAQAGHAVTLKGRASTVDAFRGNSLRIITGTESADVEGVTVVDSLRGASPFDLVVLATKSWQVADAARELAGVVTSETRVLTTQNGVDAPERVAAHLPIDAVLAGTVVVIAKRLEPTRIELVGNEATATIGSFARSIPEALDEQVLEALTGAGIRSTWVSNVKTALWKKLALIASYGGVGALGCATVGQTRSTPETRDLVEGAMREVFAVGNASGAELNERDLADIVNAYLVGFPPETTASMQRDLAHGSPSELDDQNGAVVTHAEALGIPVPIHRTIYASQLPRERAARRHKE